MTVNTNEAEKKIEVIVGDGADITTLVARYIVALCALGEPISFTEHDLTETDLKEEHQKLLTAIPLTNDLIHGSSVIAALLNAIYSLFAARLISVSFNDSFTIICGDLAAQYTVSKHKEDMTQGCPVPNNTIEPDTVVVNVVDGTNTNQPGSPSGYVTRWTGEPTPVSEFFSLGPIRAHTDLSTLIDGLSSCTMADDVVQYVRPRLHILTDVIAIEEYDRERNELVTSFIDKFLGRISTTTQSSTDNRLVAEIEALGIRANSAAGTVGGAGSRAHLDRAWTLFMAADRDVVVHLDGWTDACLDLGKAHAFAARRQPQPQPPTPFPYLTPTDESLLLVRAAEALGEGISRADPPHAPTVNIDTAPGVLMVAHQLAVVGLTLSRRGYVEGEKAFIGAVDTGCRICERLHVTRGWAAAMGSLSANLRDITPPAPPRVLVGLRVGLLTRLATYWSRMLMPVKAKAALIEAMEVVEVTNTGIEANMRHDGKITNDDAAFIQSLWDSITATSAALTEEAAFVSAVDVIHRASMTPWPVLQRLGALGVGMGHGTSKTACTHDVPEFCINAGHKLNDLARWMSMTSARPVTTSEVQEIVTKACGEGRAVMRVAYLTERVSRGWGLPDVPALAKQVHKLDLYPALHKGEADPKDIMRWAMLVLRALESAEPRADTPGGYFRWPGAILVWTGWVAEYLVIARGHMYKVTKEELLKVDTPLDDNMALKTAVSIAKRLREIREKFSRQVGLELDIADTLTQHLQGMTGPRGTPYRVGDGGHELAGGRGRQPPAGGLEGARYTQPRHPGMEVVIPDIRTAG